MDPDEVGDLLLRFRVRPDAGCSAVGAELREGGEAPAGSELRVVEVRGLTLIVDHVEEEPTL